MKLYENKCNPMNITANKEKNVHYRQNWNFQHKKKETKITESPLDFKQAFDYVNQEFVIDITNT